MIHAFPDLSAWFKTNTRKKIRLTFIGLTSWRYLSRWMCYSLEQHFPSQRYTGYNDPVSASGPIKPITVTNRPRAYRIENPIVQNMNTPNCVKNNIWANRRKNDAPRVVVAPERTEIATSVSMSCVLPRRWTWAERLYPSARWTT